MSAEGNTPPPEIPSDGETDEIENQEVVATPERKGAFDALLGDKIGGVATSASASLGDVLTGGGDANGGEAPVKPPETAVEAEPNAGVNMESAPAAVTPPAGESQHATPNVEKPAEPVKSATKAINPVMSAKKEIEAEQTKALRTREGIEQAERNRLDYQAAVDKHEADLESARKEAERGKRGAKKSDENTEQDVEVTDHDVKSGAAAGGPTLDTDADMSTGDSRHINESDEDHLKNHQKKDDIRKSRDKLEEDQISINGVRLLTESDTTPTVTKKTQEELDAAQEIIDKLQLAKRERYMNSIRDHEKRRQIAEMDEVVRNELANQHDAEHPIGKTLVQKDEKITEKEVNHRKHEYLAHLASLPADAIKAFMKLSSEQQWQAIQEAELKKTEADEAQSKKSRKEIAEERLERVLPKEIPDELNLDIGTYQKFVDSLSERERNEFMRLGADKQSAMFMEWRDKKLDKLAAVRRNFIELLDDASKILFEGMTDRKKLELIYQYRDGGPMEGLKFINKGGDDFYAYDDDGNEIPPPSYHTYSEFKNEKGEDYFEVVSAHNRTMNTLTKEQRRELKWRDRFLAFSWGKLYNVMNLMFDFEAKIAEENKKSQEMIRGIVDTGPDYNERIVFAQLQSDGRTYLDYNGNPVAAEVVKAQQKKALHNPSRFQALCHYELSKREEPEQFRLWGEIFTMMAHHGYDKYAMWGVVVGLQFMNKPSYLAYKNAIIEWAPLYETELDAHGHEKLKVGDDGGYIEKRYTAENVKDSWGRIKKDPDGKFVKIGDVMRDPKQAHFQTTTLNLHPGDQEYNESLPEDPAKERYPWRYRKIRSTTEKDENDIDENGNPRFKIVRIEKFKTKTILKLKEVGFAHELGEKFASYQYGFRSADVAITLDVARHALQTSLICARKGDFRSKEFQISQYVLSRLKQTVDTTRLGGSPGADGGPPDDAAMRREMELNAVRAGNSDEEIKKGIERGERGYPPRISGTATANVLWDELAKVVDRAANIFPNVKVVLKSDYQVTQTPAIPHAGRTRRERVGAFIRPGGRRKKDDDEDGHH